MRIFQNIKQFSKYMVSPNLDMAMKFLSDLTKGRLAGDFPLNDPNASAVMLFEDKSPIFEFIQQHQPTIQEYVVLCLALAPHINPAFFDQILSAEFPDGTNVPEFGGVKDSQGRHIYPTVETACFLLAGENVSMRLAIMEIFGQEHYFKKLGILRAEVSAKDEPFMTGRIHMSSDYISLFLKGKMAAPKFSLEFPAEKLETAMTWDDVVLNEVSRTQLDDLHHWVAYSQTLMIDWGMSHKIKPGYRALFHGPPGTGKTLTASLLGKQTDREVYRVDLSMISSKYIGETEKNLANLFDKAEGKSWILFFDEADALFGKRTTVKDAHDKYANQEVSYLLQRVESYNGLVILASNFKDNIDESFLRRFQSVIHFPLPTVEERLLLWEKSLPRQLKLEKIIGIHDIARKYELSGANIINIIQQVSLRALANKTDTLTLSMLTEGVRNELRKENKIQ